MNRRDAERLGKKIIRQLVLGVFVLLTIGQVFAQDKLPQPPDPKTIFVPDVKVIETSPQLNYDNTARVISYYDPQGLDWKSYPYPADLKDDIVIYSEYTTTSYLLLTKLTQWYREYPNFHNIDPTYLWVFDGVSGLFSRPQTQCGLVRAPLGEGRWVTITGQAGKIFCNTETGEVTKPLPETFTNDSQCQAPMLAGQAIPSPDGKMLLYFDCPPDITIYSYEIQSGTTNSLGVLTNTKNVGVNGWFENKNIILYTFNEITTPPSIYIANMTQADSLDFIADYAVFNAPRFYWDELKEDSKSSSTSLELYSYDLKTKIRTKILNYICGKTPKDCVSGLTIVNKANTRVAIVDNPSRESGKGLVVYDLRTQKSIYEAKAQVLSELQISWVNDSTLIYFDGFNGDTASLHIVKFASNGTPVDLTENGVYASPVSSVLSPDGKFLMLSSTNTVRILLIDTGKIIRIAQIDDARARFSTGWDNQKNLVINLYYSDPLIAYGWKIQIPDGLVAS